MAALSETQRKLRLQINNTRNPARKHELKQQRNRILHSQRRRARDNASVRLDHLASEVERLHDGAKMFRAVQEMTRKPASKLRIQDDSGRVICNAAELNERVTHHFGQQFNDPRVMELPAFTGVPSPLTMPITPPPVRSSGRSPNWTAAEPVVMTIYQQTCWKVQLIWSHQQSQKFSMMHSNTMNPWT